MEPDLIDLFESPPHSTVRTPTKQIFASATSIPATPKRKRSESVADSAYSDGSSVNKRRFAVMQTPTPVSKRMRPQPLIRPTMMELSPGPTARNDSATPNALITPLTKNNGKGSVALYHLDHLSSNDEQSGVAYSLLASTPTHKPQQPRPSTFIDHAKATSIGNVSARSINATTNNADPFVTIDETNTTNNTTNASIRAINATTDTADPFVIIDETNTTPTSLNLKAIPPIHPRHIPTYHNPTTPLKHNSPSTFSLKPPFWHRWKPNEYTTLSTHLRQSFDPLPLAQALQKPISEIQHVFTAVVIAPLDDEASRVQTAVEKRMERVFAAYGRGTEMRTWGGGEVRGEFTGVRPGVVELVDEMGGLVEVRFADLGERDREYVGGLVGREEMRVLLREG